MINDLSIKINGASKEAISAHYDLGNDFYSMWLDPTLTYSAGFWEEKDDLHKAQLRKMDFHLDNLYLSKNARLLDIGCGWGSVMMRAAERWVSVSATGLTLSLEQYAYLNKLKKERINVVYESWEAHQPVDPYDAVVSIGAFEHFVKPGLSEAEKINVYTKFFQKCNDLTNPNTYLSLQTITYENYDELVPNEFVKEIFPESDLPRLHQIIKSAEKYYEIITLRNDRLHYTKTLQEWFKNFTLSRDEIRLRYGDEIYRKYVKYLGCFAIGFDKGTVNLTRIKMKRKDMKVIKSCKI